MSVKSSGGGARSSLFLVAEIGGHAYAIPSADVVEVTPYVELRPLPTAVRGIAGVMNFRGVPAPVIDLASSVGLPPAMHRFSARIVLVKLRDRSLGLLAERVVRTFRAYESEFQDSGVALSEAPFLGKLWLGDGAQRPIQLLDPMAVLPAEVIDALFSQIEPQPGQDTSS